jgi:putative hydrolase of HD superfamily
MTTNLPALFRTIANLKHTPRTGWIDRGVPTADVESVADHSFMTALIAWIAAREDASLDADRVLKLALIHDLAEAIVGDRPPYEPHEVPAPDDATAVKAFFSVRHLRTAENTAAKQRDEAEAAADLVSLMPESIAGEVASLWSEYEDQVSAEARFVKQVDRLEAFLQSVNYLREHPEVPVEGFADMARKEIDHPALTAIRDAETAFPDGSGGMISCSRDPEDSCTTDPE